MERPKPTGRIVKPQILKVIERILKDELVPILAILEPKAGATYEKVTTLPLRITWSTLLLDGSLKVFLNGTDVTAQQKIDTFEATGTLAVGLDLNTLNVSGEFLSKLIPLRSTYINATIGFYTSQG